MVQVQSILSGQWTDGTSTKYSKWAMVQPNNEENKQDCGEMVNRVFLAWGLSQIVLWNDLPMPSKKDSK